MKKIITVSFLSLFLMSLLTFPGFCQKPSDILEKMIEAQGGRKLLERIKDTTVSGTIEMIQFGMNGSLTMYQKEPNKMRMDIEVMGMVITQAFDGETAWWINPQTGSSEEMPERQAEDMKRQALGNDSLLHPEKYGITYTFKGKEQIEGKDYLVLEQTFSDGFQATLYIDPQTYLTYKTKGTTTNQMGVEVEGETYFSDYKKVEGMMVPHTLTIYQDGEEFMKMSITEITFNSGLEDDLFKMSE
ncbi:MAG: outer membrane lipoprotein carrier protein LolA [Candidatus Aminicenantales bacterium]